ncbi:hypothetical protein D3C73_1615840 [compost metagenome]
MSVRIADRCIKAIVIVSLIDLNDLLRGETMDGGDDRCRNESGIGEGKEIKMVVDQVESTSLFHQIPNMQAFNHLCI